MNLLRSLVTLLMVGSTLVQVDGAKERLLRSRSLETVCDQFEEQEGPAYGLCNAYLKKGCDYVLKPCDKIQEKWEDMGLGQFPFAPTMSPTTSPTMSPTKNPTESPTKNPTESPTKNPTESPTKNFTESPTKNPTAGPSSPTETTITLDFDDVHTVINSLRNLEGNVIPDPKIQVMYHGLQFSESWLVVGANAFPGTAYEYGVVSGNYAAFNGLGNPLEISSTTEFTLISFQATSRFGDRVLVVESFDVDNNPVGSFTQALVGGAGPVEIDLESAGGFTDIHRIVITNGNGVNQDQVVIDDMIVAGEGIF